MLQRSSTVLILFAFLFLGLSSCKNDLISPTTLPLEPSETPGVYNESETQKAKDWFDNQKQLERQTASLSSFDSFDIQPIWSQALSFKNNNRFEVPYTLNGKVIRANDTGNNDTNRLSKSRLVLYKRGNSTYKSYLFDFIPSSSYTGNIQDISPDNLKKKKFSGSALVSDLKHKQMAVYIFKDGKKQAFKRLKKRPTNALVPRDLWCSTIYEFLGCETVLTYSIYGHYYVQGECFYLENWVCSDDGFCSTCEPDCNDPYCNDTYDEDCTACEDFLEPVDDNNSSSIVIITNLCPATVTNAFTNNGTEVGPWVDGSAGNFPSQQLHALSAVFTNLQVEGAPIATDIPLFEITITTPNSTAFSPQVLSNIGMQVSAAYANARANYNAGFVQQQSTPSFTFLIEWATQFNNANYRMQGNVGIGLFMSFDDKSTSNSASTTVQNCN